MIPAILHVFPPSPNSRKVLFANAHFGLDLPVRIVDLQKGEQRAESFLRLNPNAKTPVLEYSDGTTLWESNAIVDRLAASAKSDCWPASDIRYDIMRWQFWEISHWTPACAQFIGFHLFKDKSIDLKAAAAEFHRFARVLDVHLDGRTWLVGDRMTTADISVAPPLALRSLCRYPVQGYANIGAWIARMEALDAWAATDPAALAA